MEEREGCLGCPCRSWWFYLWSALPKDQTNEAGSGGSVSSIATKTAPQDSASMFFCIRHSLTHLCEASPKMSLRINLLGLCHYLLETQRWEEAVGHSSRPALFPTALLGVPKCLREAGRLPGLAKAHPHAFLLPRACPKALLCL